MSRCVWTPGMMSICPDCPLRDSITVQHHAITVVQIELILRSYLASFNSTFKTRLGVYQASVWCASRRRSFQLRFNLQRGEEAFNSIPTRTGDAVPRTELRAQLPALNSTLKTRLGIELTTWSLESDPISAHTLMCSVFKVEFNDGRWALNLNSI